MKKFLAATVFLFMPNLTFGAVYFSEIMFDPKGSDEGREWVEIKNEGPDLDLSGFKFFESDTNHKLVAQTSSIVPSGGYAIFADDAEAFLKEFPSFNGVLFDTSWGSLLNTGELLSLKDASGNILTSVTYDPSIGGKDNGDSLHFLGSSWIAAAPTPGASAPASQTLTPSVNSSSSSNETSSFVQNTLSVNVSTFPIEPQILVDAGKDRVIIAGAQAEFIGKAYGFEKKPLEEARYLWNFGDGVIAEGKAVFHSYKYPGDYIVVLDVSSGHFSGSDRLKVKVEPSAVRVSSIGTPTDRFIRLSNGSNREADLSLWILRSGDKTFTIPRQTFLTGGGEITFSADVLNFPISESVSIELLYPNGSLAHRYEGEHPSTFVIPKANQVASAISAVNVQKTSAQNVFAEESNILANANEESQSEQNNSHFWYWLGGVIAVIVLSLGALILGNQANMPVVKNETKTLADQFEITDRSNI